MFVREVELAIRILSADFVGKIDINGMPFEIYSSDLMPDRVKPFILQKNENFYAFLSEQQTKSLFSVLHTQNYSLVIDHEHKEDEAKKIEELSDKMNKAAESASASILKDWKERGYYGSEEASMRTPQPGALLDGPGRVTITN